jgi:hypothetical protein
MIELDAAIQQKDAELRALQGALAELTARYQERIAEDHLPLRQALVRLMKRRREETS